MSNNIQNMDDNNDTVALITGAGSGIGRAISIRLFEDGYHKLALLDNREEAVNETRKIILNNDWNMKKGSVLVQQPTPHIRTYIVDVSDEKQVHNVMKQIINDHHFGRIDIAINNAGIEGERNLLHDMNISNFDRIMAVNVRGIFLCMQAEIQQMLHQISSSYPSGEEEEEEEEYQNSEKQKQSATATSKELASKKVFIDKYSYSIINISSTAGIHGMPEFSAYSASKHAILGLTKSAAKEYVYKGIRINAICPGTTYTEMIERFEQQWPAWQHKQNLTYPSGRITRVEEIADMVSYLCNINNTNNRSIIGQGIIIDGGGGI